MKPYWTYVRHLRSLADSRAVSPDAKLVDAAINGGASVALRRLVPIEALREQGAFFTGSRLSKRAARLLAKTLTKDSVILDPACGAGDLLLACADTLTATFGLSFDQLQEQLRGRDVSAAFVGAARLRLALFGLRSGIGKRTFDERTVFSHIRTGSGTEARKAIRAVSHIVLNPPFVSKAAPEDCPWSSGMVNQAALFLDKITQLASPGTNIVAILPDVLRSGSRYQKWRRTIATRCRVTHVGLAGLFDSQTDVNVFIVCLEVRQDNPTRLSSTRAWSIPKEASSTVKDAFDVSIGPVVDYRDPHLGPWHKFICSRALKPWTEVDEISTHRRFKGRVFDSPFVAVKRTSRPGDAYRALATIVNVTKPVAVENHVIVLKPRDGTKETCNQLLSVLKHQDTTDLLNQRIRCRHLTVGALRELPWSAQ